MWHDNWEGLSEFNGPEHLWKWSYDWVSKDECWSTTQAVKAEWSWKVTTLRNLTAWWAKRTEHCTSQMPSTARQTHPQQQKTPRHQMMANVHNHNAFWKIAHCHLTVPWADGWEIHTRLNWRTMLSLTMPNLFQSLMLMKRHWGWKLMCHAKWECWKESITLSVPHHLSWCLRKTKQSGHK